MAFSKQPENPVVFQKEENKTCQIKFACLEPAALQLPLHRWCSTLNLRMINLLAEAVKGKTPILKDPHVSSMTHPVCVVRTSTSDPYTHNSQNDTACCLTIFITVKFVNMMFFVTIREAYFTFKGLKLLLY